MDNASNCRRAERRSFGPAISKVLLVYQSTIVTVSSKELTGAYLIFGNILQSRRIEGWISQVIPEGAVSRFELYGIAITLLLIGEGPKVARILVQWDVRN